MRHLLATILVAALVTSSELLGQAGSTPAAPDSLRLALARRLVNVVASDSSMRAAFDLKESREKLPGVPSIVWDTLSARIRRAMVGIQDSMVPLYAARYSTDELRGLLDFYASPLGRRVLTEQTVLAKEQVALIQRIVSRVTDDLSENMLIRVAPKP